ncbi:MAG TPA: hypothetical protein VFE22_15855, partial [Edaphobacter sp.]|nr:hypothetical protein [Edaphobacter sp.]
THSRAQASRSLCATTIDLAGVTAGAENRRECPIRYQVKAARFEAVAGARSARQERESRWTG